MGHPTPSGSKDDRRLDALYWDQVARGLTSGAHYMDAFLGRLKMNAYLRLLERWGWDGRGPQLKTDLFEEATGVDPLLWQLPADGLRIGMDLSPAAAAQAAANDPTGELVCVAADARHLPFADATLLRALSPSTLDHFEDPRELHTSLRELHRTLQPGGMLVITLANRSNLGDPVLRLATRLGLAPYFIGRRYTAPELRQELEAAGFRVLDQTAIIHHPRLMATALVRLGRVVPWRPLISAMQRLLLWMQRLGNTRWRYATGCFVAALAVKPPAE